MKETIISILTSLAFAGVFAVAAWLLKTRKQQLLSTINSLIQMAEVEIKGSKLGETKKAWVLSQLEVIGVKGTDAMGELINEFVKIMNNKKTSLIDVAANTTSDVINDITGTNA